MPAPYLTLAWRVIFLLPLGELLADRGGAVPAPAVPAA